MANTNNKDKIIDGLDMTEEELLETIDSIMTPENQIEIERYHRHINSWYMRLIRKTVQLIKHGKIER